MTCETSYYGIVCTKQCSAGCSANTCDLQTGQCVSCQTGYYGVFCCPDRLFGEHCNKSCPDHCIQCTSNTKCYECDIGFYGSSCSKQCPTTCTIGCVISTGECIGCLPGHFGEYCCPYGTYGKNCANCPAHCETCLSDNFCSSCVFGYYGQTCSETFSNGCDNI